MARQRRFRCIQIFIIALFALALSSGSVLAQGQLIELLPGATADGASPAESWSQNITPERRHKAQALFQEAASFVDEFLFEEAVDRYRAALDVWDHPAVHANMSMALIALGRPLDAYRSTQQALRHGPAALGHDAPSRQRNHRKVEKLAQVARAQLVAVHVASPVHKVEVFIENERVQTGDKTEPVMVLPGSHRMSAQKTGHQTMARSLDFSAGRSARVEVESVHRLSPWKPWAVLGAGVGLSLVGAGLVWNAHSGLDSLENELTAECQPPTGCDQSSPFDDDWSGIRWKQRFGVGSLILGGTGLLAGAALFLLNRQRVFRTRMVMDSEVSLAPVVSPTVTGISGTVRF